MELQSDLSTFQRNNYKHLSSSSKAVRLQWRWQELRDRERRAQQHNRQLLQDFERAQETLREMMARTAAMKMIRLDYERYLDEKITPCWQEQFKDESAQKKLEKQLKECLKRMEERERRATQPPIELPSSKGQKNNQNGTVPKEYYSQNGHLDYNLDDTTYARIQSSWLTNTGFQSACFTDRRPSYLHGSFHGHRPPPSHSSPISPHQAQPVQPYPLSSAPTYRHTVPLLGPPIWADTQTDSLSSWGGPDPRVPWTQPLVSERPGWGLMQQGVEERVERCTGSKPKEELRGDERLRDSSDHRSQELDIKPVRLSSGHEESSVTSTDSSQASRKSSRNRKQRERTGRAGGRRSTDDEGSCQHAAAIASASVDQSSESDGSLEISNGRIRKSVGQSVTPSGVKKSREKNRSKRSHSESQKSVSTECLSQSEEPVSQISGNQSPEEQLVSNRESVSHIQESESVNTRTEDKADTDDTVSEKSISAEQRSVSADEGEKGTEEETGEEDENKESSQQEEDQEREDEGEGFERKSLSEKDGEYDEDETEGHGSEGEEEDGERSDEESVEDYSATTQDREMEVDRCVGSEESREGEDDASDEEGGAEEEERRSEDVGKDSQAAEPESERDSDSDSIISPQNHRSNRNIHTIPEEVEEIQVGGDNEKESPKDYSNRSSNELSDDEDDIEYLLAPQAEVYKKEDNVQKSSDKPKAVCEDLASFSEQPISEIKETQDTDSDEFDHFYD